MQLPIFGQFLMECGMIKAEQLTEALEYQHEVNLMLGELAADMGLIKYDAILHILNYQRHEDKNFGEIAVELNYLTEKMRDKLLEIQQHEHVCLGELLVATKQITQSQLDRLLKDFQKVQNAEIKTKVSEKIYSSAVDSANDFFEVVCRVIPRMTRGLFVPGTYYQTILPILSEHVFSQRMHGDIDIEVIFLLSERLFANLGKALFNKGTTPSADISRKSIKNNERVIKDLIGITTHLYMVIRQEKGEKIDCVLKPTRIKQNVYLEHRKKSNAFTCVEIILRKPFESKGEPMLFHLCHFSR